MGILSFVKHVLSGEKDVATTQIVSSYQEETFYVVGVDYYRSNINKLACTNPDWKKTAKRSSPTDCAAKRFFNTTTSINQSN